MRLLTIISFFILILFSNCIKKEVTDTKNIDELLSVTDSLLDDVKNRSDITSNYFYTLIDDSLLVDSLAQNISIPDTIGIYQFIELSLNNFNEIIAETKSEIFFAKDQLNSIKNDFINSTITKSEYKQEIYEVEDMIRFLKLRVDSNLYLIETRYNTVLFSINDTLP